MNRPSPDVDALRLARNRIKKALREHLTVSSVRTLEIKVSERGPLWMQQAAPPHIVTKALGQLFRFGDIRVVAGPGHAPMPESPCNIIALAETDDSTIEAALAPRIELEQRYREYAMRKSGADTIGHAGETAVRAAVDQSGLFIVDHSWGDVKDAKIVGASDGILYLPSLPIKESSLLVEVKNKREWIYHDAFELWKHIRNGYAFGAVPAFFARRIYGHAFEYVFKRIGAIGIEMRSQFAPSNFESALSEVTTPYGLDYFDLRFTTVPGPRFCARTKAMASQVAIARERMKSAYPVVEPYLEQLASPNVSGTARSKLYWQLQSELNESHITPRSLVPGEAEIIEE